MTIEVKSLEEVLIDGKLKGTVLDVLTSDNKADLWLALCAWRDGFLTAKAAEIQQVVVAKSETEAELATATAAAAEAQAIIQEHEAKIAELEAKIPAEVPESPTEETE